MIGISLRRAIFKALELHRSTENNLLMETWSNREEVAKRKSKDTFNEL